MEPFLSTNQYDREKYKLPFFWHEVLRLTGDGNYTIFILTDGTQYISSKTLSLFKARLPPKFLRIHKSDIVNRSFVVRFIRERRCVLMTDGSEVKVARRRWQQLFKMSDYIVLEEKLKALKKL
jgi:DNA-binding LytR/AlgR family response regulator